MLFLLCKNEQEKESSLVDIVFPSHRVKLLHQPERQGEHWGQR